MIANAIKECPYHAKAAARRFPPLAAANKAVKARQLRAGLRELGQHYTAQAARAARAARAAIVFDEVQAWASCRQRIAALRPNVPAAAGHRPRIFWAGANRGQVELGFLQALRRLADGAVLHNARDAYGQWYGDSSGRVSACERTLGQTALKNYFPMRPCDVPAVLAEASNPSHG